MHGAAVLLFVSATAAAVIARAPAPIELRYEAPPTCPGRGEAVAALERYLGQPLDHPRDQRVEADVRVEEADAGWRLELELATASGRSELQVRGKRCTVLADLAALKIAMAVDPMAVLEHVREPAPVVAPPKPDARPPAPAVAEPAHPVPRPNPGPKHNRIRGAVRGEGAVGYGILPGVGGAAGLSAALLLRRWRLELGGRFWFARRATLADVPDAGGEIRLVAGHLSGCPVLRAGPVEFPLCVGIELGSMHGRGVGLEQPVATRKLWAASVLAPSIAWEPTRVVAVWAQAQAVISLVRPGFAIADAEEVHRAGPAGVRGLAGLEVRFP